MCGLLERNALEHYAEALERGSESVSARPFNQHASNAQNGEVTPPRVLRPEIK